MPPAANTPTGVPKAMSSRLLTMKFMQRAAASSPTSPSLITPDEPAPKRRRKNGDSLPSPVVAFDEETNRQTIRDAEAAEEARREAALEKQGIAAGDTKWVLFKEPKAGSAQALTLRVVQTGYANLDSPLRVRAESDGDGVDDKPVMVGRRSFGNFNKVAEKKQEAAESSSESDSEEEDSDESDSDSDSDDDPTMQLIKSTREEMARKAKEERKSKKKAEKAQSMELAKKRKKKEVKLNPNMTSLSGRQEAPPRQKMECFNCGGAHMKRDCPKPSGGGGGDRNKRPHEGTQGGFAKKAKVGR